MRAPVSSPSTITTMGSSMRETTFTQSRGRRFCSYFRRKQHPNLLYFILFFKGRYGILETFQSEQKYVGCQEQTSNKSPWVQRIRQVKLFQKQKYFALFTHTHPPCMWFVEKCQIIIVSRTMFLLDFLTFLKIVHIFHNILEKVKKYYANAFIVYVQFSTASLLLGPHKNVVCRTSELGVYNYKIDN